MARRVGRTAAQGEQVRRERPAAEPRPEALSRVAEALLAWIPRPEARFSVSAACHALVARGLPRWEVGRLLRGSALFHATARDPSLPEGFQQTAFRLSEAGRSAWLARHGGAGRPLPGRPGAPAASPGPLSGPPSPPPRRRPTVA